MRILLNGEPHETEAATLAALVVETGRDGRTVATAVDGVFAPRDAREAVRLTEGCRVEVLAPMQGG